MPNAQLSLHLDQFIDPQQGAQCCKILLTRSGALHNVKDSDSVMSFIGPRLELNGPKGCDMNKTSASHLMTS